MGLIMGDLNVGFAWFSFTLWRWLVVLGLDLPLAVRGEGLEMVEIC